MIGSYQMLHHLLQVAKESKNRTSSQIVDKRRGKKTLRWQEK